MVTSSLCSVRHTYYLGLYCLLICHLFVLIAEPAKYIGDYRADWGSMSFLSEFLRPSYSEGSSWFALLKKAGGGCNDLLYSGHMLVAVLTAMAWTVFSFSSLIGDFVRKISETFNDYVVKSLTGGLWRFLFRNDMVVCGT